MDPDARVAIESVARHSYGKLVAFLANHSGDIAAAEDALSDAFVAALAHWPNEGVPGNPSAWLLHAAKRKLIDAARRREVHSRHSETIRRALEEGEDLSHSDPGIPDDRLRLLFVCAHPAIDAASRSPLMLQTVLGVDAASIASSFLTSPAAMSQRLVRAKAKIVSARIPFRIPEPDEYGERLGFVLDAIYAAFTTSNDNPPADFGSPGLSSEAIALARVLIELMPDEPEIHGLLALMLHVDARRTARNPEPGCFVPLLDQDVGLWSEAFISEAERSLERAASRRKPGRYQIEAAIQSVHADRRKTGQIAWPIIVRFFDLLVEVSPGIGARIARAAAVCESGRADEALAALDQLQNIDAHQPYWATRAHILESLNRSEEARACWRRASGLTSDPATRKYLIVRAAG